MTQTLPHRNPGPARDPFAAQYNPNHAPPIPVADPWTRQFPGQQAQRPPVGAAPRQPFAQQAFAQQAFGQQAYGQQPVAQPFDIRPRPQSRRGLWIGLGVGVILIGLVVALVVALTTKDSDTGTQANPDLVPAGNLNPGDKPSSTPGTPEDEDAPKKPSTDADEEEILQLMEDFTDAAETRVQALTLPYYCTADRNVILKSGSTNVIVPTENFDGSAPTDIVVKGKRARADLNGETIKFLNEGGTWTICMTG